MTDQFFMILSSNEQIQQELEYTIIKPDCHSWWISKMQSRREDTLEKRYAIKFYFKLGKKWCHRNVCNASENAFGTYCMNRASVIEWHKRFKEGRESLRDDERCGRSKEVRTPELIGQIKNFMNKDRCVYRDNKCTVWCQCGNCTHNYSRGTEDAEDLYEVYPKGVQRRSERKMLSSSWSIQIRQFLMLWWPAMKAGSIAMTQRPRDRVPSGSMLALPDPRRPDKANPHPQTFDDPFFWHHWHDLHALGSHWTDSQQGILCWGFKGVQEEIPSEEASTLQIGSVAFPSGQCTSPQFHPCHRLFDQDEHQHSSLLSL